MSRLSCPSYTLGRRSIGALTALSFLLSLSLGGVALAQEVSDDDGPQVFDFEEDEISTDYLKPNTMMVEGLRRGRMSSLISVRLHFVDEIVRSAEDI
jgi:hypothetical protein